MGSENEIVIDFIALAKLATAVVDLLLVLIFIMGLIAILGGLIMFKRVATIANYSGQEGNFHLALLSIIAGVLMIYTTASFDMFSSTIGFGDSSSPFSYAGENTPSTQAQAVWSLIIQVMMFMGFYAIFVKGLWGLRKRTQNPNEQQTIGASILYIIFGVLAIEFQAVIQALETYLPILGKVSNIINTSAFGV